MSKKIRAALAWLLVVCLLSVSSQCLFIASAADKEGPSTKEIKSFLDGLSAGLYNDQGTIDSTLGKMVKAENTGANYVGGMNQKTYDKFLALYPNGNELSGLTPEASTTNEGYVVAYPDGNNPYYDRLYNGVINAGQTSQFQNQKDGVGKPLTESPVRLTYDLGKEVKPQSILVGATYGGYQLMQYDVYMSNDKATLYDAANLVVSYDGTKFEGAKYEAVIDPTEPYLTSAGKTGGTAMLASITLPEDASGKFFGLALKMGRNNMDDHKTKTALVEVGLYTGKAEVEPAAKKFMKSLSGGLYNDQGVIDSSLGKMVAAKNTGADFVGGMNQKTYDKFLALYESGNAISGLTPEASTTNDGYVVAYPDGNNPYYDRLYNGVINAGQTSQFQNQKDGVGKPLTESPVRLTYDLGKKVTPESILVGATYGGYQLMQYDVYMSDDKATLYDAANLVVSYDGTKFEGAKYEAVIDPTEPYLTSAGKTGATAMLASVTFPDGASGKYFGLALKMGRNNMDDHKTKTALIEVGLYEAPVEKEDANISDFFEELSGGLYNSSGVIDSAAGKMVAAKASGVDFAGGINQATYEKLLELYPVGNKISGKTPEVTASTEGYSVGWPDGGVAYYDRLYDGKINAGSTFQVKNVKDGEGDKPLAESPVKLTYDLGETISPETILVSATYGGAQLMQYNVYMSDDKATLYDAANLVASYDGTKFEGSDKWGNCVDPAATWVGNSTPNALLATVILPENVSGRYFGIALTRGRAGGTARADVALGEIAVFPKPYISKSSEVASTDAALKYDASNLLKKATFRTDIGGFAGANLTNGNYSDVVSAAADSGKIIYLLDNSYMIEKFAIATATNAKLAEYEIYLSNDIDELFESKNKVLKMANLANGAAGTNINVDEITLNEAVEAKYVGFKINKGGITEAGIKINELVVSGSNLPDYTVSHKITDNAMAKEWVANTLGKNILLNTTLEYKNTDESFGYESAKCHDDDYEGFYLERDGGNPQLTFTLRGNTMVSDFAISSVANYYGGGKIRIGEYKVYLSTDKAKLYSEESCVAHVVGEPHVATQGSIVDVINLREAVEAKYVGIEILKDNLSDSYTGIRPAEFAAFGSPLSASIDSTVELLESLKNGLINAEGNNDPAIGKAEENKADGVDYNGGFNISTYNKINSMYLNKNLLAGKTPEVTTDEGFTVSNVDGVPSRLGDGIISPAATYQMQVKNSGGTAVPFNDANARFTYDLGSKKSLELLVIGGTYGGNQQTKYKVYVSNSKEDLYSSENLVTVYDLAYTTKHTVNGINGDVYCKGADSANGARPLAGQYIIMSGHSGRYVGIALAGNKTTSGLSEIALWASRDVYTPQLNEYGTYAEEVFNVFDNGDFEAKITEENWGPLNDGITVDDVKTAASHGSKALTVKAGKTQTWHFTLKPDTEYSIGFYTLSKAGKADIILACDDKGTPFENVIPESVKGDIDLCTFKVDDTNDKWERIGYTFFSAEYTDLYLTVSGVEGEVKLDDAMLFTANYGKATDPNDYAVKSPAYAGNVEVVDAETGVSTNGNVDTNSPQTGDTTMMSVWIALLALSTVTGIYTLKARRSKQ